MTDRFSPESPPEDSSTWTGKPGGSWPPRSPTGADAWSAAAPSWSPAPEVPQAPGQAASSFTPTPAPPWSAPPSADSTSQAELHSSEASPWSVGQAYRVPSTRPKGAPYPTFTDVAAPKRRLRIVLIIIGLIVVAMIINAAIRAVLNPDPTPDPTAPSAQPTSQQTPSATSTPTSGSTSGLPPRASVEATPAPEISQLRGYPQSSLAAPVLIGSTDAPPDLGFSPSAPAPISQWSVRFFDAYEGQTQDISLHDYQVGVETLPEWSTRNAYADEVPLSVVMDLTPAGYGSEDYPFRLSLRIQGASGRWYPGLTLDRPDRTRPSRQTVSFRVPQWDVPDVPIIEVSIDNYDGDTAQVYMSVG